MANDPTLVASMLSLDISGAFDNVSHERLIHNIRDARMPQWVATYIRSFLTGRTTTLTLGTYEDRVRSTTSGISQDSTLSPILFLFFASTLLPQLNAGATTAIGFVRNQYTHVQQRHGSELPGFGKSEREVYGLRTHTRRNLRAREVPADALHSPPLEIQHAGAVQIPKFQDGPVLVMRILGIHLDLKLKWGPHVNLTAAKAASHTASITRVIKSTWGATIPKARQIYAAVVRPVLSYWCPVWILLGDERANRNKLIYPIQTVQNKCLRTITGAYKTTNVQVLEHEASVAPLDFHLEMLAVSHVHGTDYCPSDRAVEEARKATDERLSAASPRQATSRQDTPTNFEQGLNRCDSNRARPGVAGTGQLREKS